ncbi:hypothetical protein CSUI_009513 [Cystoisospora suis]|uniref:Uncharacterized protein n=1 Tax=Cystoisospora suis TaxID=483139 RepID=A0A2C6JGZ1_9APIC|nr:hypothetical protein CSUI_009513 [Cystoisospora suis]
MLRIGLMVNRLARSARHLLSRNTCIALTLSHLLLSQRHDTFSFPETGEEEKKKKSSSLSLLVLLRNLLLLRESLSSPRLGQSPPGKPTSFSPSSEEEKKTTKRYRQ